MLGQTIGISSKNSFITFLFAKSYIFHFHVQSNLEKIYKKSKIPINLGTYLLAEDLIERSRSRVKTDAHHHILK